MQRMNIRPHALLACLLLAASSVHAQDAPAPASLRWISSTQSAPWEQMPVEAVASSAQTSAARISTAQTPAATAIQLDSRTAYQTIDGFGSCFNDLGWQALQALDPPAREAALQSLFSPSGANFTLGRAPIGANDFATGWYSYDETPGDFALTHFSIDHDRQTLIPFIHAAMRVQPALAIWAVPWSPPTWMKTNGAYKGGEMKNDPQTLASYALYFSKYIQAYRAEGIHLFAVMPQNEPRYNNNVYPQAAWSGALMNVFLRDYLVPRLQQDKLSIQVWQGTIVNENIADYILPVLDDPRTAPSIAGVAYQYGGQQALARHAPALPRHQAHAVRDRVLQRRQPLAAGPHHLPQDRRRHQQLRRQLLLLEHRARRPRRPAPGAGDRTACSPSIAARSRSATTPSSTR